MKEAYVVFWRTIVSGGEDGGIFEEESVVCLSITTRDRIMKEKMDKYMKAWRDDNGEEPWEPYTSQLTGETEGPAWRSVEVLE